jgi:uncharacterized protein (DUF488 family)
VQQLVIFTLGYQLRSQDDFVNTLENAGVGAVVDVRQTAWSNRREYAKGRLSSALEAAGITYVHASFAGNPKELRRSAASHDDCLRLYAEYIRERPEIVERFHDLIMELVASAGSVCLVCYERHPEDCHRFLLLESWQEFTGEEAVILHLEPSGAPRLRESPIAQGGVGT